MPNTVVKLTNAESTWLEAAREDRKLLIKKKHIRQDVLFTCLHLVQGSGLSWRLRRFFRGWYSRIVAFPSRGRCPAGADRADMV